MKNRITGVLIGQIIGLLIVCFASSFIALISFGGIAGVVIGTRPSETLLYFAPYACKDGEINYEEYTASYNRPGETNIILECVHPDGTKEDVVLQSIGLALLAIYMACFLPMCLPGGLVALVIPMFFLRGGKKKDDIQPPSAIGSM